MTNQSKLDPDLYEKNWPKLTAEEKADRAASAVGNFQCLYNELIEEKYGKDAAFELAADVIDTLLMEAHQNPDVAKALGVEGRFDAFATGKKLAYGDEEIFRMGPAKATVLEASKDKVVRKIEHCAMGDTCGALECYAMMEGGRRAFERLSGQQYTITELSSYPDTHECYYVIHKKGETGEIAEQPHIDPEMYEKNWPKLTAEESRQRILRWTGRCIGIYNEKIEKKYGQDEAFAIAAEVVARFMMVNHQNPDLAKALGIEGRSDALAIGKRMTFGDETVFGIGPAGTTCTEASADRVVRRIENCPAAETCGALECYAMHEGMRLSVERLTDQQYTVSTLSHYPDTGVCSYAIEKKG